MKYPDDKTLAEIGRVCVAFSELESNYALLVELMTDVSSRSGAILAAHLSFQKMLDVVGSLFLHHFPEHRHTRDLEGILKRSADVEAKRNTMIHSYYFIDSDSAEVVRSKSTAKRFHGLKHQREVMSAEKLSKLASELEEAAKEVESFSVMLMGEEPIRSKLHRRTK